MDTPPTLPDEERLKNLEEELEETAVNLREVIPKPQKWYNNEIAQTILAALFFIGMTSIIVSLSAMFAERLIAYFQARKAAEALMVQDRLLHTSPHLRTQSQPVTSQ